MNELVDDRVIRKVKRGEYEIVANEYTYELSRAKGDLDNDTYAYDYCLKAHIEKYNRNIVDIWSYAFSEMINNVMDHSLAENVHIVVKTDYVKTSVMIFDNGVGIFNKIREYFSLGSKLMDNFFIASSGKIFANNKYDDSRVIDLALANPCGTCVFMELSNYSHKEAREVFDAYANVDGGFIKTRIPLKNIFAHQLFVVFANSHPDITITPVNMNEDINKMYNHVRNANNV